MSGWRRLGTGVIDLVCSYVIFFVLVLTVGFIVGDDSWLAALDGIAGNFIGIGFFLLYYIGFESAFARTPGKFVLETIVVDEKMQ